MDPSDVDALVAAAAELGWALDRDDAGAIAPYVEGLAATARSLGALEAELRGGHRAAVPSDRRWRWPESGENPLGAWYARCSIGGGDGPLSGLQVAVKDNVAVAGVPMTDGSALLDGYVPSADATVVARVLAAGGEITGKAVCEDLCLSAGSHTASTGPVRNPRDPSRTSGGSSSGSAALVAAGACDLAIGGDQGGSVRVPASYCGIVGHKPTWGLVPYTGAASIEPTIDHLGPMGPDVTAVARLLSDLAGPDGLDPRQQGRPAEDYVAALTGPAGLRVGVVAEGFDGPDHDGRVDACGREALAALGRAGATVVEVSVPWHGRAGAVGITVLGHGLLQTLVRDRLLPPGQKGGYPLDLAEALDEGLAGGRAADVAPTATVFLLAAHLSRGGSPMTTYARAQNLVPALIAAYDEALRDVDVLAMPTTPTVAPPLPAEGAGPAESLAAAFTGASNTSQFDITGHPAASVPCGAVDGLPVGLMLVGRRGADATVLRAAHAVEQLGLAG